jgi:surface protein
MELMFAVSLFNDPIEHWDVGTVTNMSGLFLGATAFNQPLATWDVSNVTNMSRMFMGNYDNHEMQFNQPIDAWDVGNVTDMTAMFRYNSIFNQPIGSWNTGNVTSMRIMFSSSHDLGVASPPIAFNQPIGDWDVSNVKTMFAMFGHAINFNQPLNNWNVSQVTDMARMFQNAISFNQNISGWCVDNIDSAPIDFATGSALIQGNIPNWGTCGEPIDPPEIVTDYILEPNFPNPFNPVTTIRFGILEDADVQIDVYNSMGQRVKTFSLSGLNKGMHNVTFNGAGLASGVYLYRINIDGRQSLTRKMVLMK